MSSAPKSTRASWMWLAASLILAAEFLVFMRMTARHHADIYPRWNDQIAYLHDAYTAYEKMQTDGFAAGLRQTVFRPTAQGTLHDTCALLVFWLAGSASRTAALSLNMLAFLAWQAALLFTLPRVSGSRIHGWMGFGLVLALAGPWVAGPGSALDFRLDHAAMCLFGVTACAALLSDGFRSLRWSLVFGALAGVTLLERFLTGAYFAPIFFLAALWALLGADRWLRLRHLLLAGLVTTLLALPVFWLQRSVIYGYYWVGHVTGDEGAARIRGFDLGQSVRFLSDNLARLHFGPWFGWTVLVVTVLLFALLLIRPRKPAGGGNAPDWLFFSLLWWLVPATILTFHKQKSEFVLGVIVPGVVLLVLWLWAQMWKRVAPPSRPATANLLSAALALAVLVAGGAQFLRRQVSSPYSAEYLESNRRVLELADYIYHTSRAANLPNPDVGIDRIVDYIDGRILQIICYERHGKWVDFQLHLPDSILAGPDENVFFKLAHCDFVLFTELGGADYGNWPYDRQMRRLSLQVQAWCNENLVLAKTVNAFGREMALYQRPGLP
jgi:hypothetical protein